MHANSLNLQQDDSLDNTLSNLEAIVVVVLFVTAAHLLSYLCLKRGSKASAEQRYKDRVQGQFSHRNDEMRIGIELGQHLLNESE